MLLIILLSIKNPLPDFRAVLNQELNLTNARDFVCLGGIIPGDEDALFIGGPTNESNILAIYYRTQYHLAPRIITLAQSFDEISNYANIDWFISLELDDDQLKSLENNFKMIQIIDCGNLSALHTSK